MSELPRVDEPRRRHVATLSGLDVRYDLGAGHAGPWADEIERLDARAASEWDLPIAGAVAAPAAVLIRPDGHVAWTGDGTDRGLREALDTWLGPPSPRA